MMKKDFAFLTLSFGTRGECVKTAQEHLNAWAEADLREMLSTDGIFGAKTLAAVKAFQASHGLADSGVIDEKTWNALIGESTDNDNSDENDGNTESDTDGAEVYSQRLEELLFELDTLINKYRG
jgi:peptidoglycan hydrolase-like protein with peptidoglycan-binding domain